MTGKIYVLACVVSLALMGIAGSCARVADPPFWEGNVTLVADTAFTVVVDSSGESYDVSRTTALGALDAAAAQGGFSYTINDEWYDQYGALLVDSIAGKSGSGIDGWQYWVNYPDEPLPWTGVDSYELADGDTVDFFYGGYGVTPDTSAMLIRIHTSIVEDTTPPELVLERPAAGGVYILDREVAVISGGGSLILGPVTVVVRATDALTQVDCTEIYIDDDLKVSVSEDGGEISWTWNERAIGLHTVRATAADSLDNTASTERIIWIVSL
jgi:hypothetical protein